MQNNFSTVFRKTIFSGTLTFFVDASNCKYTSIGNGGGTFVAFVAQGSKKPLIVAGMAAKSKFKSKFRSFSHLKGNICGVYECFGR